MKVKIIIPIKTTEAKISAQHEDKHEEEERKRFPVMLVLAQIRYAIQTNFYNKLKRKHLKQSMIFLQMRVDFFTNAASPILIR